MNEATLQYVRQHADDDVRLLALRGSKDPEVDLSMALQQIQGRQTARRKLPSWATVEGIVYPPHLNMEQCSSEQTARYKADLCRRLLAQYGIKDATTLFDLTGGLGVDFALMSEAFAKGTYVERNTELFAIAKANFAALGKQVETVNADGLDVLTTISRATVIYLDPARRDDHGARTYGIADCTPNVLDIRDTLLEKAELVILKLSPMLDWRKAVSDLCEPYVREVHIVSVDNECKELLLVLSKKGSGLRLVCVNDGDELAIDNALTAEAPLPALSGTNGQTFLYEPNASIMKAGCFAVLTRRYQVQPLAQNSHLFVSEQPVTGFPGRCFQIKAVSSLNKRSLKTALADIRQANISVRNFPMSVAELRKRLKLADGGDTYLFATTLANGERVLYITEKC